LRPLGDTASLNAIMNNRAAEKNQFFSIK